MEYDAFNALDLENRTWYMKLYRLSSKEMRVDDGNFVVGKQHILPTVSPEEQVWPPRRSAMGSSSKRAGGRRAAKRTPAPSHRRGAPHGDGSCAASSVVLDVAPGPEACDDDAIGDDFDDPRKSENESSSQGHSEGGGEQVATDIEPDGEALFPEHVQVACVVGSRSPRLAPDVRRCV